MKEHHAAQPEEGIVSFYTFNDYEASLDRFSALYAPEYLAVCPDKTIVRTLKHPRERKCRFCGLRKPDTSFNNKPHVIPEMLGNKYLISDYECDKCNATFSTLENDLANFVGASRAIYDVKGKKLPVYKSVGEEVIIRKEEFYGVKDGTKIAGKGNSEESFSYNKETGALEIKYLKHAYTPIKVYKALLKIALSIMPEEHIANYAVLLKLMFQDADNILARFATVTICRLSTHLLNHQLLMPRCHLNKRINDSDKVCMHVVSFYFLDYVIEMPLPLHAQDVANNLYDGTTVTVPLCPPLFLAKPNESFFNSISINNKWLSGIESVREEEIFSIQHTADALRNTEVYNPATGEMRPSDGSLPNIVAVYMSRSGELPDFPQGPFVDNEMDE